MSRPRYERPEDVTNEFSAIGKFAALFPGATVTRLSDDGRGFAVLSKGREAKVVVEVKTRTNSVHKYPTFMISKSKYDALHEYAKRGMFAGLLVQWADMLGFTPVPVAHTTSTGGRYDRNDPKDIETVVLISTTEFERIG